MKPQLKVGLEIHTQLQTLSKLFANSPNPTSNLSLIPNTTTSFFDVSLPGTQPKLNNECVFKALKLALSLNCKIPKVSAFDRKHYFYGDQPLGYQITQHYHPIALNGSLTLLKRHHNKLTRDLSVRIQQLQLEQDTGRSIYHSVNSNTSNIDFNRANIPLVEMVTLPDFQDVEEVRAFLQTYIKLVQDLEVCTGDLETGALRVDVNINVTGHERVEIKNLPTISAIINAIRYESKRQTGIVLNRKEGLDYHNSIETRGWDGKKTYHLRDKESAVDYRYVPDMELPKVKLDTESLIPNITLLLPKSMSDRLDLLMSKPENGGYALSLRDAKILINNDLLMEFYIECWNLTEDKNIRLKLINWLVHELLGTLTKSEILFSKEIITSTCFTDLVNSVESGKITKPNGKLILLHLVNNKVDQAKSVVNLAGEFGMIASDTSSNNNSDIQQLVADIISKNAKVVDEIKNKGKVKKINFLIGLCMRQTRGNVQPKVFEDKIKELLKL